MNDCIFCEIVENKIPVTVIDQNDDLMVIEDIAPKAPIHYLIISKKHIKNVAELEEHDAHIMAKIAMMAKKLSRKLSGSQSFRLIINNGAEVGQTVWHLHCHFIAGTHPIPGNHISDC